MLLNGSKENCLSAKKTNLFLYYVYAFKKIKANNNIKSFVTSRNKLFFHLTKSIISCSSQKKKKYLTTYNPRRHIVTKNGIYRGDQRKKVK